MALALRNSDAVLSTLVAHTIGNAGEIPMARVAQATIPSGVKAYLRANLRDRFQAELLRYGPFARVQPLSPSTSHLHELFFAHAAEGYVYPRDEYLADLENAAHFTENYVCRPRWTLSSFLFHDAPVISVSTLLTRLEYVTEYVYLPQLLRRMVMQKQLREIGQEECTLLIRQIDSAVVREHTPRELALLTRPIFDYFLYGAGHSEVRIPLKPIVLFFRDKELRIVEDLVQSLSQAKTRDSISLTELADMCDDYLTSTPRPPKSSAPPAETDQTATAGQPADGADGSAATGTTAGSADRTAAPGEEAGAAHPTAASGKTTGASEQSEVSGEADVPPEMAAAAGESTGVADTFTRDSASGDNGARETADHESAARAGDGVALTGSGTNPGTEEPGAGKDLFDQGDSPATLRHDARTASDEQKSEAFIAGTPVGANGNAGAAAGDTLSMNPAESGAAAAVSIASQDLPEVSEETISRIAQHVISGKSGGSAAEPARAPRTSVPLAPRLNLERMITPEQRKRFIAVLCDRDADFYELVISRLNIMRTWTEAAAYIRELFEINSVDPWRDEAITFTDIVQQRFGSQGQSRV